MLFIIAAVAATGLAVGCGSDSDATSASGAAATVTTSSLSKAQLIKRADAACLEETEDILQQMVAYSNKPSSKAKPPNEMFADLAREVVLPVVEAQIADVAELGAPAGDEQRVEAILDARREGIEEVRSLQTLKAFGEIEAHFVKADRLARAYGFKDCTNTSPVGPIQ